MNCPGGGIGRHAGLKILWLVIAVRVQLPSRVQALIEMSGLFLLFLSITTLRAWFVKRQAYFFY